MPVIDAGNLDRALFIDQIRFYIIFFLIFLQQAFDIIDIHAHADDTDHLSGSVLDLAVDKQRDLVGSASHLIVIDIKVIFLTAAQKIIIPDVFRFAPHQITVQPIEIVVIIGSGSHQKYRVISIFIFIGLQILPERLLIAGFLITAAFLLQQLDQQTVVGHRLRNVHRFGQHRRQAVVNTFRRQRRNLLDLDQRRIIISAVAQSRDQGETNQQNHTDE